MVIFATKQKALGLPILCILSNLLSLLLLLLLLLLSLLLLLLSLLLLFLFLLFFLGGEGVAGCTLVYFEEHYVMPDKTHVEHF